MFEDLSEKQRKILSIPLVIFVFLMVGYLIATDFVGSQMRVVETYLEQIEVSN